MSQYQYSLIDRISSLQNHIQTIMVRLQSIQKIYQQYLQPHKQNPLEKYLGDRSEIQSIQFQDQKVDLNAGKFHSRYRSQTFGDSRPIIKRFEDKQKTLGSKSFGIIKRSILLNEEEMEHLRQKMVELEKYCIDKFMGIEEGISILTRLTSMIESKLDKGQKSAPRRQEKEPPKDSQYQINRVIKKYNNKSTKPISPFKKSPNIT